MRKLGSVVLDYLRQLVWFLLASTGVSALFTFVLPLVGYDTFGDRPGPGWHGLPSKITWAGVSELGEYALALPLFGAMAAVFYFAVPFVAVRLLERTRLPRYAIRVVGALLCAAAAFVVLAAAGWYISLGIVAGATGIVGGAIYGARKLPRTIMLSHGPASSPVT
jgi:hypothetical protein